MCARIPSSAPPTTTSSSISSLSEALTTVKTPHAAIAPISFLLGKWTGEGSGKYPTVSPFKYHEEVTFWHDGKPYIGYMQRTFSLADGTPMHMESGYIRCRPNNVLEMTVSDPTGISSVFEGTWNPQSQTIELRSTTVTRTSSAKEVNELVRKLHLSAENTLSCTLDMAAVKQPLQEHLVSILRKEK